jgi:hypothetical protein
MAGFWLRPTLVATIVGLVLLTVLVIVGSAALLMLSSTRDLFEQYRKTDVAAAIDEMRALFVTAAAEKSNV